MELQIDGFLQLERDTLEFEEEIILDTRLNQLQAFPVAQLKDIIRGYRLKISGKKEDLIFRIMEQENAGSGGEEVTVTIRRWKEGCINGKTIHGGCVVRFSVLSWSKHHAQCLG